MANFTDIPNEFLVHPITKDLVLKTDDSAVRQSIRNLVNLSFGEKPWHPEIVVNIRGLLFENVTPFLIASAKRNLTNILETYEPRAEILDVLFGLQDNEGALSVSIIFKVINSSREQTLEMYFDRIR